MCLLEMSKHANEAWMIPAPCQAKDLALALDPALARDVALAPDLPLALQLLWQIIVPCLMASLGEELTCHATLVVIANARIWINNVELAVPPLRRYNNTWWSCLP